MGQNQRGDAETSAEATDTGADGAQPKPAEIKLPTMLLTPELQEAANRTRMRVTSHPKAGPRGFRLPGSEDENVS